MAIGFLLQIRLNSPTHLLIRIKNNRSPTTEVPALLYFYPMRFLLLLLPVIFSFQLMKYHPVDAGNAVTFNIKNFGIGTKGEFSGLKGTINWDASNPSNSFFDVTVDAATINTAIKARDNDLRGEKYFDVQNYPVIRITSTKISDGQFTGKLTIKGITRPVSFPFTATAEGDGVNFKGSFSIRRSDFNVGGGSAVLSDHVDVELNVSARK